MLRGEVDIFIYVILEALVGIVVGILLAIRTKKAEGITYGKLDKVGRITNILLIPLYACTAPFYMFLGMICSPNKEGFLGILGWIISIVCASAALFCSLGLGFSVALRKKGKSKLSFAVQFAGVVGVCLELLLYAVFVGNLISPLN